MVVPERADLVCRGKCHHSCNCNSYGCFRSIKKITLLLPLGQVVGCLFVCISSPAGRRRTFESGDEFRGKFHGFDYIGGLWQFHKLQLSYVSWQPTITDPRWCNKPPPRTQLCSSDDLTVHALPSLSPIFSHHVSHKGDWPFPHPDGVGLSTFHSLAPVALASGTVRLLDWVTASRTCI